MDSGAEAGLRAARSHGPNAAGRAGGIHHADASPREGVPLQVVDSPVAARRAVVGHLSVEANASTDNQVQVDQSVHGDGTSSSP